MRSLGERAALYAVKTGASALRSRTSIQPYMHGTLPGYKLQLGGNTIGHMVFKRGGGQVQGAEIAAPYRGLGLGKKFYGEVMRRQEGQTLRSDQSPSIDATRVWESMARDPSYKTHVGAGWKAPSDSKTHPYLPDWKSKGERATYTFEGSLPLRAALPDPHEVPLGETAAVRAVSG